MDDQRARVVEERIVLESMFGEGEIEFRISSEVGRETSLIRIHLGEAGWLELELEPEYPLVPAIVRVSGPTYTPWDILTAVGQEVAESQSLLGEVSAYATYAAVQEAKAAFTLPKPPMESTKASTATALDHAANKTPPAVHNIGETKSTDRERKSRCGVSARFLLRFALEHGISGFKKFAKEKAESTGAVCFRCVVPATVEHRCTFSSLGGAAILSPEVGPATCFVSHAWRESFASLVTSLVGHQIGTKEAWEILEGGAVDLQRISHRLERYFDGDGAGSGSLLTQRVEHFYWVDIFCKNQHVVESGDTAEELADTVRASAEVLLVLHPLSNPVMLTRVWCLFEVSLGFHFSFYLFAHQQQ